MDGKEHSVKGISRIRARSQRVDTSWSNCDVLLEHKVDDWFRLLRSRVIKCLLSFALFALEGKEGAERVCPSLPLISREHPFKRESSTSILEPDPNLSTLSCPWPTAVSARHAQRHCAVVVYPGNSCAKNIVVVVIKITTAIAATDTILSRGTLLFLGLGKPKERKGKIAPSTSMQ